MQLKRPGFEDVATHSDRIYNSGRKRKTSIGFIVGGLGVLLLMKKGGPVGPGVVGELNPVFN